MKDSFSENSPFARRMRTLLDAQDYAAYCEALTLPPKRMARKNPLKQVSDALIAAELGGYPLLPDSAKPGHGVLHAAGAYYVQEPAAAAVASLIAPLLPNAAKVLDMCAAPGGKVTAAAASRPDCLFVANEVVFSRAKILLSNVERMGLRNCTVTSLRPDEIARRARFDAIIADVPCSGEGMLRKAQFGADDLSDESVAACAVRARKILDECDACLCGGGLLLFSTCTFNTAENEQQVEYLMREKGYEPIEVERPALSRPGYGIEQAVRFFPQDGGGEGHFACLLRKPQSDDDACRQSRKKAKQSGDARIKAALSQSARFTREVFAPERIVCVGEGCELLPPDYPFAELPALRRGMRIADFAGDRAVLHHHFATAAVFDLLIDPVNFAPDAPQLAAYLAGGEFACDAPDGFRAVCVASLPLGLVKVSGGTAKNRYPKGLRLNG